MSKAFLLLALALIIAMVSAGVVVVKFTGDTTEDCNGLGYEANGTFWVTKAGITKDTWSTDASTSKCATALATTATDDATAANVPCFVATVTKAGAATGCGIATDDACVAASDFCVSDNQCIESKCALQVRFVITKLAPAAGAKEADLVPLIQAKLDALKKVADATAAACPAATNKFEIVTGSSNIVNGWALVKFSEIDADCITALQVAVQFKVQQSQCVACASYFGAETLSTDFGICPCTTEYIISRALFTLVEGKKQSDLEKLFKVSGEDTNKCIAAKQFIGAGDNKVLVQLAVKYNNEACTKESTDRSASDEYKAVVASATGTAVYNDPADCVTGSKFTSCASAADAKCSKVACAKGTKCTAATADAVCAGACTIAEGKEEGKCNSSSVVGYVVAVVAVVAAFVF